MFDIGTQLFKYTKVYAWSSFYFVVVGGETGSFACFGVAVECAASKCAKVRSTAPAPRHCA
jgi:hypothetical protein